MFKEIVGVNSDIKGDAKLWRYMDFSQLVSLISTESIYLRRSDKFKDVFEGVLFNYGVQNAREDIEAMFSETGCSERFIHAQLENAEKVANSVMERAKKNRKKCICKLLAFK
ncbi:hypothetical protein ACT7CV_15295 [Bacillus paranthracis]